MRLLRWQACTLLACGLCAATLQLMACAYAGSRDIDVKVRVVGDEFRTYVSLFVPAPRQHVWDVLTDYDRAPQFTPDLEESKVIRRTGDTLRLFQKSRVRWGPFAVPFETVSDIRLTAPERTETRLVSGSMDKYESVTELMPEAGGTRLIFRSQAVPGSVLAHLAGESLVKREAEEHFRQLRAEIVRRQQIASQ